MFGIVHLVGAGPGDPGLITVHGIDRLRIADAVVYDRLVHPGLLEEIPEQAEKYNVGKRASHHTLPQDEINALLIRLAGEGKIVVRLKGGDPFVFGRGGEEALALVDAGIPFEIVPGVTAGVAAAAYAGIPVTHRGVATQCLFVTAHEAPGKPTSQVAWDRIAALENTTLVGYMGVTSLPQVVKELLGSGKDPATPAALVERGTTSSQRCVTATLGTLIEKSEAEAIRPPALFIIGETVDLAGQLQWFGMKPLAGKRLVITRARDQASALADPLRLLGAEVIHLPVIRTQPFAARREEGEKSIARIFSEEEWEWVLFTSENGVRYFLSALAQEQLDLRILGSSRIAAVGSGTAGRLRRSHLEPDFVPSSFTTHSLADELNAAHPLAGRKVLRVGPELTPDPLMDRLAGLGAEADALRVYRIAQGSPIPEVVDDLVENGAQGIFFTSGSTVSHFFSILGKERAGKIFEAATVFAIGPVTRKRLLDEGVSQVVMAEEHSIPGLLRTARDHLTE